MKNPRRESCWARKIQSAWSNCARRHQNGGSRIEEINVFGVLQASNWLREPSFEKGTKRGGKGKEKEHAATQKEVEDLMMSMGVEDRANIISDVRDPQSMKDIVGAAEQDSGAVEEPKLSSSRD